MPLQLKAEAKRMTDAQSRPIDTKVYGKALFAPSSRYHLPFTDHHRP